MRDVLRHIPLLPAEWILYGCTLCFFVFYIGLDIFGVHGKPSTDLLYYGNIIWRSLQVGSWWIVSAVAAIGGGKVGWFILTSAIQGRDPKMLLDISLYVRLGKRGLYLVRDLIRFSIPTVVAMTMFSLALSQVNTWNTGRLKDLTLVYWEHFFTGVYPFLILTSLSLPYWFLHAVIWAFSYLAFSLMIAVLFLFVIHRQTAYEAVSAFFILAIILIPIWLIVPVMSPQDRFIDNVYDLPIPPALYQQINEYQPSQPVHAFFEKVRTYKKNYSMMPTTTFPSAHVAWATLLVYYLWRARRWYLLAVLPYGILAGIGTVLLGQHYLADVPAGFLCGLAAIVITRYLFTRFTYADAASIS